MPEKQPIEAQTYVKNSLVFLVLSLASAAINYAYYPVISHFLSPAEFGAVQALVAILLQASAVFAGLNLVTIYLVNKLDYDSATKAVEILQKLTTSIFLLITLGVLLFQTAVLSFLNIDRRLYIFILALDLITTIPFIIAFGYLQARRQFVNAGSLQLVVVLVKLGAGALLASAYGPAGALAGIAVGQVFGMLLFWALGQFYKIKLWDHKALGGLMLPSRAELNFIKPQAKNALSIFAVNITLVIYTSFAVIAARHYFAPHLSGLFAGAALLGSAIVFACLPLIGVLLPHLNPQSLAASRGEIYKTGAMVFGIIIVSCLFLNTFATQLLKIFGSDYPTMSYLMLRLAIMMSIVAALFLTLQVGAFYKPLRTAIIVLLGLAVLVTKIIYGHDSLSTFVSTITLVFATILLIACAQLVWIYNGSRSQV